MCISVRSSLKFVSQRIAISNKLYGFGITPGHQILDERIHLPVTQTWEMKKGSASILLQAIDDTSTEIHLFINLSTSNTTAQKTWSQIRECLKQAQWEIKEICCNHQDLSIDKYLLLSRRGITSLEKFESFNKRGKYNKPIDVLDKQVQVVLDFMKNKTSLKTCAELRGVSYNTIVNNIDAIYQELAPDIQKLLVKRFKENKKYHKKLLEKILENSRSEP